MPASQLVEVWAPQRNEPQRTAVHREGYVYARCIMTEEVAQLFEDDFYFQGWRDVQEVMLPGVVRAAAWARVRACVRAVPPS